MKKFTTYTTLVILALAFSARAAEKQYQQGTILTIERKSTTRTVYYVVDTPITKDDPYYVVSVRLRDMAYTARYTPRHKYDELPDEWKAGATVEARVHGRHLVLKDPGGTEVELVILKKKPSPAEGNQQATPANK